MRGVRDEFAASMIEAREPDAHALEGPRKLAQLVRAAIRNRRVESAAGDPLGGPLEPANSAREQPRCAITYQQGDDQRQATSEE